MSKDILFEMVSNKRGGINPSFAIQAAIIEAANLDPGTDCRIETDPHTGQYKILRYWEVVPDAAVSDEDDSTEREEGSAEEESDEGDSTEREEDSGTTDVTLGINQMTLTKAREHDPEAQPGQSISEEIHFSRIEFQKFKRLFSAEMRNAERNRIAEAYRNRIGEVLIGTVKRQQFNREGTILELEEDTELFLSHEEMIPKEEIRLNDRLYVYLSSIDSAAKGPQLLVSRKAPELLEGLFKLKILEVESGIIEVKSVARDPGSRSKVAVKTNDGRLNPIGTCIGRSGERVQAISSELNEEHIDIILWDDNPAQLAIHALAPAEVVSITMDEDTHVMDIAVRNEDLPRAIGRNGQNVRLASQLTGWTLNIMSSEEAEKKSIAASLELETLLAEQLGIETQTAQKLVQAGFTILEEVANAEPEALVQLLALEATEVEALLNRANDLLLAQAFATQSETFNPSEEDESLESLSGMTDALLETLESHDIHSRDLLAELSIDDLLEIAPLTREEAGQLIMKARAHWFKESEKN